MSSKSKSRTALIGGVEIKSPQDLPDPTQIERVEEPWMRLEIVTPKEYLGQIMKLAQERKAVYKDMKYLDVNYGIASSALSSIGLPRNDSDKTRVILHYEIPLVFLIIDFYDKLKSVSQGYASLNYEFLEYRPCEIVKLDILVAEEKVEALATIVYKDEAYQKARKIVDSLKDVLPRQLFEVKIQGMIGGKIIASARLPAMRKDVTAKLYGGDVTRKKKLLEKQKKGKRRMKRMGRIEISGEVFRAVLKT